MLRIILFTVGIAALVLGMAGIVVPLLPATPFFLLAAACFLRSSSRLHGWLLRHPVFGNYLHAYQRFQAVSVRAKILSIVLLWTSILSSSAIFIADWRIRICLWAIAAGVSVYILRLKTLTDEMVQTLRRERAAAGSPKRDDDNG